MALRTGHGNGKGSPRVEVMPPDEQPQAQAVGPDPLSSGRDKNKRIRTTAAAVAMAKLPRRKRYLPRQLACDPRFEPHNWRRLEWQRKRVAELQAAHGGVSCGVGAMVNATGWLYAGGEFAAELAAKSGDVELFKTAASLTGTARQHELAAWELGAREAKARPATDPHAALGAAFGAEPEPEAPSPKPAALPPQPVEPVPEPATPPATDTPWGES